MKLIEEDTKLEKISLLQNKYDILLTSEVLLELMNVKQQDRINRIKYLSRLSNLKCLHYKWKVMAGTIADLRAFEYKFVLTNNNNILDNYISSKITDYNSSFLQDFFKIPQNVLDCIIAECTSDNISASIPSWVYYNNPKKYRSKKARNIPAYQKSSESFRTHIENINEKFIEKADAKKDAELIKKQAFKFVSSINYKNEILSKNLFDLITELSGYPSELFDVESTVEDLILRHEYIGKLTYFNNYLNIPIKQLLNINEMLIKSWIIEKEFKREYERMKTDDQGTKAEASSIIDKYLAAYSAYFTVFVDKRTYTILNKVKSTNRDIRMKFKKNTEIDAIL